MNPRIIVGPGTYRRRDEKSERIDFNVEARKPWPYRRNFVELPWGRWVGDGMSWDHDGRVIPGEDSYADIVELIELEDCAFNRTFNHE